MIYRNPSWPHQWPARDLGICFISALASAQMLSQRHQHIGLHHACYWAGTFCVLKKGLPKKVFKVSN